MNLQENISRIKGMMGLIIEDTERQFVKIYSDGGGSDDGAEYEGKIISIPVENTIPNEPFKDLSYMENSKVIKLMIKSINSGEKLPPIKVIKHPYDSSKYLVVDGNHRRYAFGKSDKENIDAVVVPHKDVLLMKNKWGEKPEEFISLNDVIDDKEIIDQYFVKPDSTNSFEINKSDMNLNEDDISKSDIQVLEKMLNSKIPKRYPWWKRIDIEGVGYSEERKSFLSNKINHSITIYGFLYVDSDWVHQTWEYRTEGEPFPDGYRLNLVDLLNTTSLSKILNEIKLYYEMIVGVQVERVYFSDLEIKLVTKTPL